MSFYSHGGARREHTLDGLPCVCVSCVLARLQDTPSRVVVTTSQKHFQNLNLDCVVELVKDPLYPLNGSLVTSLRRQPFQVLGFLRCPVCWTEEVDF